MKFAFIVTSYIFLQSYWVSDIVNGDIQKVHRHSNKLLFLLKDTKPRLCTALESIAKDCIESFNKCFSQEDAEQIKRQHIQQMQEYYEKIYSNVGNLSDCPQLKFLNEEIVYDEEENEDTDEYDEDGWYTILQNPF